MTTRGKNRYDVDNAVDLDDEVAALVRSLDELDAERARGELSAESYDRLHATYTARTAQAVRDRARNSARRTLAPPRSRRGRALAVVLIAACALVAAVALRSGSSERAPGQTITGNAAGAGAGADADLRRAVAQNPNDPRAHDALAASLMQAGEFAAALEEFDKASRLDPRDVVALTYSGWIAYLAGSPEKALPRLAQAVAADPSYPDAHAFRGIVLLRSGSDAAAARAELEQYLTLVPDGAMSEQVKAVLEQAKAPKP
jgi:Tfp pilus assembly protein PilF